MALEETSTYWQTNEISPDAVDITEETWSDVWSLILTAGEADEGVAPRYLNQLVVTVDGQDLTLDTGGACVDGIIYRCLESGVAATLPIPIVNTTGHRLVIRANRTTKLARAHLLTNFVDGVEDLPALTQNDTIWDIPIWGGRINLAGEVDGASERQFLHFATAVSEEMQETGSTSTRVLADDSVTSDKAGIGVPAITMRGSLTDETWGTLGSGYLNHPVDTPIRVWAAITRATVGAGNISAEVEIELPEDYFAVWPILLVSAQTTETFDPDDHTAKAALDYTTVGSPSLRVVVTRANPSNTLATQHVAVTMLAIGPRYVAP